MRKFTFLCVSLALAVLLAGCSKAPQGGAATPSGGLTITGAGATFPYPIYSKWFDEYHKLHPDVRINYQAIGSGGGIRQLEAGTVDFGASDQPLTDEQIAKTRNPAMHIPTVLGAVVAVYNIPNVTRELNLTPEALAGIFLGKITKWNDPAIAKHNPGVALPAADIVVVHRSDGSGTTFIWTDYLSRISPEWKAAAGSGTSVNWPAGLGGKGNEGVSGLVRQTPNSLGYVELIYAVHNNMSYARVRNAAGEFIKPDLKSVTAAAASARNMPSDFRVSIANPAGRDAYPIASFTWLLVPARIADPAKRAAMKDLLHWLAGPGQQMAEPLSYAPLPAELLPQVRQAIERIQ